VFIYENPDDPTEVWGYYTLSAGSVEKSSLSGSDEKRSPFGFHAPMARIGFMGRADAASKGLGSGLLLDAARRVRCIRTSERVDSCWSRKAVLTIPNCIPGIKRRDLKSAGVATNPCMRFSIRSLREFRLIKPPRRARPLPRLHDAAPHLNCRQNGAQRKKSPLGACNFCSAA